MTKLIYTIKAERLASKLTASEGYIQSHLYSVYGSKIGIQECARIASERFNSIKSNPQF